MGTTQVCEGSSQYSLTADEELVFMKVYSVATYTPLHTAGNTNVHAQCMEISVLKCDRHIHTNILTQNEIQSSIGCLNNRQGGRVSYSSIQTANIVHVCLIRSRVLIAQYSILYLPYSSTFTYQ